MTLYDGAKLVDNISTRHSSIAMRCRVTINTIRVIAQTRSYIVGNDQSGNCRGA
jgi:hypothetical protein